MSIWIYLTGSTSESENLYEKNLTSNFGQLAVTLGVFNPIWNLQLSGITKAHELLDVLIDAYHTLRADKEQYRQYEAKNGWGTVEQFLAFLHEYIVACQSFPYANVEVSR